jgi:hypothetical protein
LRQSHGITVGILARQLNSFASAGPNRASISQLYLQPFVSYTTNSATSFTLNTESTYDWNARQWTAPLNLMFSRVVKFGTQPVQFLVGGRYYLEKPVNGPDWGLRFQVTFTFPEKHL